MNSNAVLWRAQWIGRPDATLLNWQAEVLPAPLLRHEFRLDAAVESARVYICGLGCYELVINGVKIGDHVLDPIVSQYDCRVNYVVYDVSDQVKAGANAVAVMLGNGWYNCHTPEAWHFDKAGWRDYPKLLLQLEITLVNKDKITICSGPQWKVGDGPIRFDGLRNGETYDARLERTGWDKPGYDDSDWQAAAIVASPGGVLQEQSAPACKVMQTIVPVNMWQVGHGVVVYDLGQNIAGWIELHVQGPAGTEVVIRYGERLTDDGALDQTKIASLIRGGDCQTDRYILKGNGVESWQPRFTYHGFRYVQIEGLPDAASLANIRGQVVHSAFAQIGRFACSDPQVNRLQECTLWSYRGNFVGIPTDCPHREKNGWTGDAQLAAETGLMNFAAAACYRQWLQTMADVQRPSGQLPGIVPSCGWGYNWGNGPAWDSALVLIPWYIYLYTGDLTAIEQHYDSIRRYVDFCGSMATDYILSFGLGDWCPVHQERTPPAALTSTAYYYVDVRLLAKFAALTGHYADVDVYNELAAHIQDAFNARFYQGGGIYGKGEMTALGCALYQGLVQESERPVVVQQLAAAVEANACKVDFGILGAKYVPRALAENGHVELAYRLIVQPEFPGWMHWLRNGCTTLRESWEDGNSGNHIMFGDVSAWMYHYLAGIRPDPDQPGFRHILLQPHPVPELDWVQAAYQAPHGLINFAWRREGERYCFELEVPTGSNATLQWQDTEPLMLPSGLHTLHR